MVAHEHASSARVGGPPAGFARSFLALLFVGLGCAAPTAARSEETYYITPAVLEAHRQLLRLSGHSVMAISRDGHLGGAYCDHGSDAPCGTHRLRELALQNCRGNGGRQCEVFAIADRIIVPYVIVEPEPGSEDAADALTGTAPQDEPALAPPDLTNGIWSGETADWEANATLIGSAFEGRGVCKRNGTMVVFSGEISEQGIVSGRARETATRFSGYEDRGPFSITGRWPQIELNLKRGCGSPKVPLQTG